MNIKTCSCGQRFYFTKTATGRFMPTNLDGSPHWSTCKDTKEYKPSSPTNSTGSQPPSNNSATTKSPHS